VLAYGSFITQVINFLILAWIIFLMVKAVNNLRRKEEPAPGSAAGAAGRRQAADGNPRSC
jgi:large conductance mechanosensitive channel